MSATLGVTVDATRIRCNGHGLTPGSFAGAVLTYTSYDGTRKRTATPGVIAGELDGSYEVDGDGNVRIALSRNIMSGGTAPGRLVVSLATTASELVHDNAELT